MNDIFAPLPRVPVAAAPGGPTKLSAAPATHPLNLPGKQRLFPQPVRRSFRRSFLDRQDPFHTAGRQMEHFSFPGSYELCGAPGATVVEEIQSQIVQRLVDGNLADAKVEVIDFNDAKFHGEPPRRFVVASTDTRRRTMVTVNAFVQAHGGHLYFSVRSYLLPPLSFWKLLLALLFSYTTFVLADKFLGIFSGTMPFVVTLLVVLSAFRGLVRNLFAGDPLPTALRKQFPKRFDWGTFNNDDVSTFLRASLQLTLGSITSVLEAHGVEVSGLKAVVQNLQSVNIQMNNGNIVGAIIGGAGNIATGKVGP